MASYAPAPDIYIAARWRRLLLPSCEIGYVAAAADVVG